MKYCENAAFSGGCSLTGWSEEKLAWTSRLQIAIVCSVHCILCI